MRASFYNRLRVTTVANLEEKDPQIETCLFDKKFVADQLRKYDNFQQNLIELVRRSARILSFRQAMIVSHQLSIKRDDLAKALWFIFYTELCNTVSARLVAKKLHNELRNKKIFIPLHKNELVAFQEWNDNSDLLPLYHYIELEKRGLQPTLVTTSGPSVQNIQIILNKNIISSVVFIIGKEIFCPKATRGTQRIFDLICERKEPEDRVQKFSLSGAEFDPKSQLQSSFFPQKIGLQKIKQENIFHPSP